MKDIVPLLWIAAIAVVFWLLIIRPASRRQKELARMQSALSAGDEVLLSSGVFGTVSAVADTHLMVEIADGVTIKVARGAVANILRDEPAAAADESADEVADEPAVADPADRVDPADPEER